MNQVVETRDWKTSFSTMIPRRKRTGVDFVDCQKKKNLFLKSIRRKRVMHTREQGNMVYWRVKNVCVEVPLESGS